ncbi:hypothetical protein TREMEDRAFT_32024 [Tremella mesenterica DSM 1558]|uniref:uncharacterized protein n=1 Tax=Tremella mesenterica (strain ATCC 24925 / CBS 8224 / DSM 1558 / NBRC 9311 / NRRL Y-6157 / RJB 2259-6 / UBC 559-6) TaxID=578456 RepID=UPI0003F4A0AF|nr:uncharacterized protein TREMEDRAFT_32024 [Tremella mesenterica DSM 1558]EIW68513.1 hypothetical protein TREMEDRAFT_32024 [Tremella mesenterica DSM 1558]
MPTFPEGGLRAWLCIAGSWLAIFVTFGYSNTFGVFQDYYQFIGYPDQSASNISWVGSVQLFLQFSMGAIAGPLYDKGYFYHLVITGSVIYIVGLFMTSLCKEFWQTVLAQGICVGLGIGLLFLPALSIISHYFHRRRALAIGIAVTGSSTGGICLPIMLNNLIASHGFRHAVQYTGYLIMGCLLFSIILMKPRIPPNPNAPPRPSPKQLFSSLPYTLLCAALFFISEGIFFPIFYLQVYAQLHGVSHTLVFYTLAILNAASVFGRLTPNMLADSFGPLNLSFIMSVCSGIIIWAMFGAGTNGGLIVVTILYGFFSGAYVSMMSPALISLAHNFGEIGMRMGMGMLVMSFAALSGTPITGALLDRYGFYAPIIWSGVCVLVGSALTAASIYFQIRVKGTWKV